MSRNAISANPEHYIFKMFPGSMPPDTLEGLQKFFQDRLIPKQKILDRTLPVRVYAFLIPSSQASARSSIVGNSASALTAQSAF